MSGAAHTAGEVAFACRREELGAGERAEMRALLDAHFEGVSAGQFDRDLDGKQWVLRIRRGGRLAGFSTLAACRSEAAGEAVNVLYSGDTIMAPEAWGTPALARGWIAMAGRARATLPPGPCHWLLLSSGFRTYRFLPVFWREFWPRAGADIPEAKRALRDALARERFGARYDAAAGIVRLEKPQRLRGRLAEIPAGRENDPHVRCFLANNPGWREGDELACLTEISERNLTAAGRRIVREAGA